MYRIKYIFIHLTVIILLLGCSKVKEQQYENQIGDTSFDSELDNVDFKLCNSSDVLHKRAFVNYTGGMRAIEEELFKKFKYNPDFSSFNGYFIVRFVVNCNDNAGRYRMEILNSNFELSQCPESLENYILSIVKSLNKWKHAVYDHKDYDGYKFLTIKIVAGQMICNLCV